MTIKVIVNSAVKIRTRFFTEEIEFIQVCPRVRSLSATEQVYSARYCYNSCNAIVTLS